MQTCTSSNFSKTQLRKDNISDKLYALLRSLWESIVEWNRSIWTRLADFVIDNYGYNPTVGRGGTKTKVVWH